MIDKENKILASYTANKDADVMSKLNAAYGMSWCLIICITPLIISHIYYLSTASSTIEFVALAGGNPFWKGDRKSEKYFKRIHNENK